MWTWNRSSGKRRYSKCFTASNANRVRAAQEPRQPHLREFLFSSDCVRERVLTKFRFFSPADIRGIGSFQDGGLRNNLAADIARRVCRQIWPSRKNPARMLSMGTGVTPRARDRSPHFRHIYKDGFIRRGFDAWMSSMDTEMRWLEMVDQLEDTFKPDYLRFNIPLQDTPDAIDTIDTMEEYRNRVVLHSGGARKAREAATALLVSRLFFELDSLPDCATSPLWCHGTIRCKGPSQPVMDALGRLHPEGLDYTTDSETIGKLVGPNELCSTCGRYCQPVSFLAVHFDKVMSIYVRSKSKQRWRISGFPESVASISAKQQLHAPFGRFAHGCPGTAPCKSCDEQRSVSGIRRKRSSVQSQEGRTKRVRCEDKGGEDQD